MQFINWLIPVFYRRYARMGNPLIQSVLVWFLHQGNGIVYKVTGVNLTLIVKEL